MMAGNPNYWSMNDMHPQSNQLSNSQFVYNVNNNSTSVTSVDSTATAAHHPTDQDFPVRSWSQLLLGGLATGEEKRFGESLYEQQNKLENWEEQQVLDLNSISDFARNIPLVDMKQEVAQSSSCQVLTYNNNNNSNIHDDNQFHQANRSSWPHHQVMPVISSPTSCVTTLNNNNNNNNFFDFSGGKPAVEGKVNHQHNQEHSSECNSTSTGGVSKKARVQQSSAQPALKVRKEKLGDRITALHQLVSPFGKALSSPYMRNASVNSGHHHPSVQERNCLFPQEAAGQDSQRRGGKDLRSRGLCLVPISCTENVGNDTGADYWAPSAFGDGF